MQDNGLYAHLSLKVLFLAAFGHVWVPGTWCVYCQRLLGLCANSFWDGWACSSCRAKLHAFLKLS